MKVRRSALEPGPLALTIALNEVYSVGLHLVEEQGWRLGTGLGSSTNKSILKPIIAADHPKGAWIGFNMDTAKPKASPSANDKMKPG
jgi:hypothetical protein